MNNLLFEQLERLNDIDLEEDDDELLKKELNRAKGVEKISKQIVSNATLALKAKQYLDREGLERAAVPESLQLKAGD